MRAFEASSPSEGTWDSRSDGRSLRGRTFEASHPSAASDHPASDHPASEGAGCGGGANNDAGVTDGTGGDGTVGDDVPGGDGAGCDGRASPDGAQRASEELGAMTSMLLVRSRRRLTDPNLATNSSHPNMETQSDNPNLARQGWQRSLSTSTSTFARGQRSGRRFEWPSLSTSTPSRALSTSALASADGLDAGTASAVAAGLVALTRGGDVEGQARAAHALATLALDGEGRSAIAC